MSWLEDIIHKVGYTALGAKPEISDMSAKQQIVNNLLNLIEQAKEKDLPLTWLIGEIKKL